MEWEKQRKMDVRKWAGLGLTALLIIQVGCGGHGDKGGNGSKVETPNLTVASPKSGENSANSGSEKNNVQVQPVAFDPTQQQTFLDATLSEPPEGEQRPPDVTKVGKSVGKMYQAIAGVKGKGGLWDQVKFVSENGKKLHYSATIKTTEGTLEMELWPDVAPNHVRNFVALARAGYYDGLSFDRAIKEEVAISPGENVQYIEGGCPLGTGEAGYGSIGYWMKPEISEKVKHEEGTVGAGHGEEVESAACKFYITLNQAKWLDGNFTIFGKITQGLDVARKIFSRPRLDGFEDRLQNSVQIEQVTIHVKEG